MHKLMWKVRKFCAIKMYLNAQKEWLAGEAPHLEHHRTRWKKNNEKEINNICKNVEGTRSLN